VARRWIQFDKFIPRVMTSQELSSFLSKHQISSREDLLSNRKALCDFVDEQVEQGTISPELISDLLPSWRVKQLLSRSSDIPPQYSDKDLRELLCSKLHSADFVEELFPTHAHGGPNVLHKQSPHTETIHGSRSLHDQPSSTPPSPVQSTTHAHTETTSPTQQETDSHVQSHSHSLPHSNTDHDDEKTDGQPETDDGGEVDAFRLENEHTFLQIEQVCQKYAKQSISMHFVLVSEPASVPIGEDCKMSIVIVYDPKEGHVQRVDIQKAKGMVLATSWAKGPIEQLLVKDFGRHQLEKLPDVLDLLPKTLFLVDFALKYTSFATLVFVCFLLFQ